MKSNRTPYLTIALWALLGCSANSPSRTSSTGGSSNAGGSSGSNGGRTSSGGNASSGGTSNSGGVSNQGGSSLTGSGGTTGSGGKSTDSSTTGGTMSSGGTSASSNLGGTGGGVRATGGNSSGGGSGRSDAAVGGEGGAGRADAAVGGTSGSGGTSGTGGISSSDRPDAATGGTTGSGGTTGTAGPCDMYQSGSTPCVAAHSMVRALYAAYNGNLYQVRRASDKKTQDVPTLAPGGFVNASVHETFCANTTCTISYIYDQSPLKNDMPLSPPVHWLPNGGAEADAAPGKAKVGGHTVYGLYVKSDVGNTYRNNKPNGVPVRDEPESIYMVADGKHFNGRCCFDYGNVETTGNDDGPGTMETIEFGAIPNWSPGSGTGPWVMADLEDGVFAGGLKTGVVASNTSLIANYVTLMLKGYQENHMTLKGGDAQSGSLMVKYDGKRPTGYETMKKQGAVELGVGGDGSAGGVGTFFEGAIIKGISSDAVDDAIQANIVATGYGK